MGEGGERERRYRDPDGVANENANATKECEE